MTLYTWLRILTTARHYRKTQRLPVRKAVQAAALLHGQM